MMMVLDFAGAQTLRQAEETLEKLRGALAQASEVLLDCSRLDEVDLSFIQLVLAARRSADRDGKILGLIAPAKGALLKALDTAGILPSGPHRFWFEGRAQT